MDQELFNPQSSSVSSSRVLYTPSSFARTSLLHLQEVGSLQAVHPHTSTRKDLVSFLCFVVLSGKGELKYEGVDYELRSCDCVFIDCRKAYNDFCGEAAKAVRFDDPDIKWQTVPWPKGEYILSDKDRNAMLLIKILKMNDDK